jgi:alginate O-acetyltransferase complex protein AlgF
MALEDIAPNTSRQVSLRAPMTLDFEVRDGDTVLANLPAVQMRRRAGVTVVFSGSGGNYTAFSTENSYVN